MFKDIVSQKELNHEVEARIDSNTDAIDDLEKQGNQRDLENKQLKAEVDAHYAENQLLNEKL